MNDQGIHDSMGGDTFNFYGSIGQFIKEGDGIIHDYHAQSVATSTSQQGQQGAADAARQGDGQGQPSASPDEEWIDEIVSCFMGDRAMALEFVGMARNMKPTQITELVNAWLAQRKISSLSCKRDLWQPLSDHGIYPRSESCWNGQVHIPR